MLTLLGLDHVVLRTDNLDAMQAFYVDVLHCTVERDVLDELGLLQLRAGNALIDLVMVDSELGRIGGGKPTKTENNMDHLCLQIEPMDETAIIAHLRAHDVEFEPFAERYGAQGFGRSVYLKDPDGNTVELKPAILSSKTQTP